MTTYRPDIDGLRAICIVSVVMFHGKFKDWSGGFVGVDIFFVISGFLITSLIGRQMTLGQFSLLGFYERRVRRLLAATIPVIIVTTLFALTFYTTDILTTYCKSLIAFVAYSSNWFFLNQVGYFNTPPEVNPLLHTWSLGVEEQFYLVFPALLLLLLRFPRAGPWTLAALAAISFAYAQFEISRDLLDRAFFSSFSRFWELLAGALLAMAPALINKTARIAFPMRAVGLATIGASVFLYGPGTPFPGVAALLPVCGALLLIAASPDRRDPVWKLLTAEPVVYVGKISYSLYLWHWPLMGATRTLLPDSGELPSVLAIALSVGLAALTYRLIEKPIRERRTLARGRDMGVLLASTSAIALVIGSAGWAVGSWQERHDPSVDATYARAVECFELQKDLRTDRKFCRFGNAAASKVDVVLWGDSHARSVFPAINKYAETRNLSLVFAGRSACPPLLGVRLSKGIDGPHFNQDCPAFNNAVRTFIRENNVSTVVLAARWSMYANGTLGPLIDLQRDSSKASADGVFQYAMERTLDAFDGQEIVIVEQAPDQKVRLPTAYVVRTRLGRSIDEISKDRAEHDQEQRLAVEAMDRVASRDNTLRIDPAPELCGSGKCVLEGNGKLLYFNTNHLSIDGSLFLYPLIERELDRFRATRRFDPK
jgi:peptidoglycan/LPS O-acetylase OafA/YrhL